MYNFLSYRLPANIAKNMIVQVRMWFITTSSPADDKEKKTIIGYWSLTDSKSNEGLDSEVTIEVTRKVRLGIKHILVVIYFFIKYILVFINYFIKHILAFQGYKVTITAVVAKKGDYFCTANNSLVKVTSVTEKLTNEIS